jgi:hypothetical protein
MLLYSTLHFFFYSLSRIIEKKGGSELLAVGSYSSTTFLYFQHEVIE